MNETINRNPALSVNYILEIPNAKELNYFVQSCQLPGLNMSGIETPYKNINVYVPSNRIEYDELSLDFLVDESWANWNFVFNWMKRCRQGRESISDTMSDITLNLVNSNKALNKILLFRGAFPTTLSALSLESSNVDSTPLVCSVGFRFQEYELITGT